MARGKKKRYIKKNKTRNNKKIRKQRRMKHSNKSIKRKQNKKSRKRKAGMFKTVDEETVRQKRKKERSTARRQQLKAFCFKCISSGNSMQSK